MVNEPEVIKSSEEQGKDKDIRWLLDVICKQQQGQIIIDKVKAENRIQKSLLDNIDNMLIHKDTGILYLVEEDEQVEQHWKNIVPSHRVTATLRTIHNSRYGCHLGVISNIKQIRSNKQY